MSELANAEAGLGARATAGPDGPAGDGGAVLAIERATVLRAGRIVLEEATLRARAGRVLGIVGANGAGKSTLIGAAMGELPLAAGVVRLAGLPPAAARRAGVVAHLAQLDGLDARFPVDVREVVEAARYGRLGLLRRLRPADREAVAAAIEQVGLAGLERRPIGALSGGQRRRALVARAIAQEARVVLLDEPFAGVDVRSAAVLARSIRRLAAHGAAVVVVTHDLDGLSSLVDEAVEIRDRRVVPLELGSGVRRPAIPAETLAEIASGRRTAAAPSTTAGDGAAARARTADAPAPAAALDPVRDVSASADAPLAS